MTRWRDGTRRKCTARNPSSQSCHLSPGKRRCGFPQCRKCKTAKENLPNFVYRNTSLSIFVQISGHQVPRYAQTSPAIPWHSGATTGITIHYLMLDYGPNTARSHVHFSPLNKFETPQWLHARWDKQVPERRRMVYDRIISGFCTALINLSPMAYKKKTEKQRRSNYCHYSLDAIRRATSNWRKDPRR
jgi:hypothetical protein